MWDVRAGLWEDHADLDGLGIRIVLDFYAVLVQLYREFLK